VLAACALAACSEAPSTSGPPAAVAGRDPRPRLRPDEPIGCTTTPPVRSAPAEFDDGDPGAVRLFYDVLSPYGAWRDDPRIGLVWTPSPESAGAGFVPYATHGRWTHRAAAAVPDDARARPGGEYVWVSDLPWGWVTFHYGRWTLAGDAVDRSAPTPAAARSRSKRAARWSWVPGRRYAGAWVDWRVPAGGGPVSPDAVVGWGPTPPSLVWRVTPRDARAFADEMDVRDAWVTSTPYVAFATPYTYARARDLFAPDLSERRLAGEAALAVAQATEPAPAPDPSRLGFAPGSPPEPPAFDRGLQQAWALATPATANAVGAGPELPSPPRLRTWVAGGPRFLDAER
jgi:hypothetical protein